MKRKEIKVATSHLGQPGWHRIVWGAVVAKSPWEKTPPSSQWLLQGNSQGAPPTWKCAGSPKNQLLSGQQGLKLLGLVLSSKTRHWIGKGGDKRAVEENLGTGEWCDFCFSLEQLFAAGNLIYSLYLFT